MSFLLPVIDLMMLNLTLGSSIMLYQGVTKKDMLIMALIAITIIAFIMAAFFFLNLTLPIVELTIENEMQYVHGMIVPDILPFLLME